MVQDTPAAAATVSRVGRSPATQSPFAVWGFFCIVTDMFAPLSIQNIGGVPVDLHAIGVTSGYLGATLGVGMVVPQIVRTLRNRHLTGVSPLSWSLTVLACFTWLTYGLRTAEVPQIPGNVLIVSGSVVIVLLVPSAVSTRLRALRLAGAALRPGRCRCWAPPTVLGLLLVLDRAHLGVAPAGHLTDAAGRRAVGGLDHGLADAVRLAGRVAVLRRRAARHRGDDSAAFTLSSALVILTVELRRRTVTETRTVDIEPAALQPA